MSVSFPVSPKKQEALLQKMLTLGIRESDLEESFVRSSGNGGQNVNKVSTAVRLVHKPSGEEVKCNVYRTQGLNRYKARAILCERLESKTSNLDSNSPGAKRVLKIRKSKEDKARRARKKKERLLQERLQENDLDDSSDEINRIDSIDLTDTTEI
ncbi:MAG: peptide chain release factor-like protein [Leptospira sp.]|nr:peptide chain release factor-like protein [Leptospira sp.]